MKISQKIATELPGSGASPVGQLHELRIESFFPADEATEAALRRLETVSQ
ncbi:MAG: hypothetical protein ACT4PY_10595 [Armatimonadota bacterium]